MMYTFTLNAAQVAAWEAAKRALDERKWQGLEWEFTTYPPYTWDGASQRWVKMRVVINDRSPTVAYTGEQVLFRARVVKKRGPWSVADLILQAPWGLNERLLPKLVEFFSRGPGQESSLHDLLGESVDHVSLDIAVACCPLLNGSPIAAEVAGWLERLDLPEPVLSGDNDSPERREPLTHEHWYLYEMIVARDGEPEVNMATKLMNAPHCLLQRFAILYGFKIAWPVEVTPNGFLRYAQPGQPEDSEVVDLEVQVVLQELASTLGLAVEIFWSGLSFYAKWPRANMWLGDGTDLESAKDRLRALAASPYTPRREVSDG